MTADNPTMESVQTEKQLMGVDYEFFIDGRESLQTAFSAGGQVNQHIILIPFFFIFIPIPVLTILPSYSYNENKSRTSVSNKVIVRSGILEEVHAFD